MKYKLIAKAIVCTVTAVIILFAFWTGSAVFTSVDGYVVSEDGSSAVKVGNALHFFDKNGEKYLSLNISDGSEGYEIFQTPGQDNSFYVRTSRSENYYEYDFQGIMLMDLGHSIDIRETKPSSASGRYSLIYRSEGGNERIFLTVDGESTELDLGFALTIGNHILPLTFALIAAVIGIYVFVRIDKTNSVTELLHMEIKPDDKIL
ncbi:MAG: hypothetical protein ACI4XF_03925 [Oscillospiraceae bacterium]